MSGERVSASQRITVAHLAEVEIMRYKDDHALWHKHVHGVDLDPMQVLKCIEMDMHPNTIDVSCRRTGKTAVKEMHALKHNACNPFQEVGIVAPRQQQAQTNLTYHIDAIRRSPILSGYLAYKSGRQQLSDTKYQLYNQSKGIAYGIMSQIDGDGLSYASLEEMDDMPAERLYSNFSRCWVLPVAWAWHRMCHSNRRSASQVYSRVPTRCRALSILARITCCRS
jgi:hypothetical protein